MALPYTLDPIRPKQLGLIVLQADETLEGDMRRMLPLDVACLVSRVPSGDAVTAETLQAMDTALSDAAALLPRAARFAGVAYGCTSGTAQIGALQVAARIRAGVATPFVTEPVTALIAACQQLGVTRIGVISPYIQSVSDRLRDTLATAGIDVTQFASFEEPQEEKVARIAPAAIHAAAVKMGQMVEVEAVFLSCTNLRTLDVIAPIEAQINKPVLSSNQVLAWHLGRAVGAVMQPVGALFTHPD